MLKSRLPAAAAWLALLAIATESREARTPSWDKIAEGRAAGKPVLAVIGLRQQKITVYDSAGPILQAPRLDRQPNLRDARWPLHHLAEEQRSRLQPL